MQNRLGQVLWGWLPKKSLSRCWGRLSRHSWSRYIIPYYVRYYDIDLSPVKHPIEDFQNLLEFFIREYHPEARPVDPNPQVIVSPVDGTISQIGPIKSNSLLQVKGNTYTLEELLGGHEEHIQKYLNGTFVTIYLSPSDYHRIHMPIHGQVSERSYLSGELFPVNERATYMIPRLFARNERLVSYIQTTNGEIGLIKVGATNVGSIKVTYDEQMVTNQKSNDQPLHKKYQPGISLKKGEELGRFEFGSTVILLFEPNMTDWCIQPASGTRVQMGQALAHLRE